MTAPADLAARYGATSRSRRAWLIGLVGVVVAAFLGWLTWVIVVESSPPVNSDFLGFAVLDDNAAKAFVAVALEEGVDATCVVRAFADDHSVVGELSFTPHDGRNDVDLRTDRRATSVELVGCTAAGQPRPR